MTAKSILEVNLAALANNVQQIRSFLSPHTQLCAVVKANAYGLGAARIAPELQRLGVTWQAVYDPEQAEEILTAGVTANVLILMPVTEIDPGTHLAAAANAGRIHFTVHSLDQAKMLSASAQKLNIQLPVHIEIDTGMSRGGQLPHAANELITAIKKIPHLHLAGIFTHPSSADDDPVFTDQQLADFHQALNQSPEISNSPLIHHFSNTWATLANKKYHLNMVRAGLGLWGYPGAATWQTAEQNGIRLQPIARWLSHIVHIKDVPANSPVGYGQTFHTQRPTRIALIPTGYADGYPLLLSNRGIVRIGSALIPAPLIGRVNMDQIIIDITDVPHASVNDTVELVSSDPQAPNALHKLAPLAQSHPYEMLCRISPRIPRVYHQ